MLFIYVSCTLVRSSGTFYFLIRVVLSIKKKKNPNFFPRLHLIADLLIYLDHLYILYTHTEGRERESQKVI